MSPFDVTLYHYALLKGYLAGQNAPSEILAAVEALYQAAVQGPLRADALDAIQAVREAAERLSGMATVPKPVVAPLAKTESSIVVPDAAETELPALTKRAIEMAAERPKPPTTSISPQTDEAKSAAFLKARAAEQCPPAHGSGDDRELVVGASEPKKQKEWSPEARAAAAERLRARQAAGLMKGRRQAEPEVSKPEPGEPDSPNFVEADLRITVPLKRRTTRLTDDDWPDIKYRIDKGHSRKAIAGDYDEELEDLDYFIQSCEGQEVERLPGEA